VLNAPWKSSTEIGLPASVAGLARAARVSRSWIYTQPDLLRQLQRQNQTARKPRQGPTERASDASLHRRLELAHQRIQQLAEDNQRLGDQLARAYGALRAASTGHVPTGRGKG
jgi:small-conductance mechanosensitive channel